MFVGTLPQRTPLTQPLIATRPQRNCHSSRLPPKRTDQYVFPQRVFIPSTDKRVVLTGSKDATMLLGEIEAGLSI